MANGDDVMKLKYNDTDRHVYNVSLHACWVSFFPCIRINLLTHTNLRKKRPIRQFIERLAMRKIEVKKQAEKYETKKGVEKSI